MPKDTSSSIAHHGHGQQPVIPLKRNQACRQCRKRKMKCDAQRPCRGCVRSHGTIVANLVKAGQPFPPVPECTYDGDYDEDGEVHLPPQVAHIGAPGNAIAQHSDSHHHGHGSPHHEDGTQHIRAGVAATTISPRNQHSHHTQAFHSSGLSTSVGSSGPHRSDSVGASVSPFHHSQADPCPEWNIHLNSDKTVYRYSIPSRLGTRPICHHPKYCYTFQTFFQCQIFANTLLHRSSFLSRLQLPPSHPQYPSNALLHAICADASLYGAQGGTTGPNGISGFGAMHAGLCMAKALEDASMGKRLLETVQGVYLVVRNADQAITDITTPSHWADNPGAVGGVSGHSTNWKVDTIMQPTTDSTEVELRRRAFWHAYMLDRVQGAATAWPMAVDDLDIGQELPLTQSAFDAGVLPPDVQLQRLSSPGLLTTHALNATDSFILYVKSVMLMSRVSNFNVRLRTRHGHMADLPQSPAFKTLESQIASFRLSFPKKFRDPFANGVDPILLMAHTIPLMATIILQEPHSSASLDCAPSIKCLEATRLVLDGVYRLSSTSFDFSHLTNVFTFFWTVGSKVLMRKYAKVLEADEQAEALCEEVENRRSKVGHGNRCLPRAAYRPRNIEDVSQPSTGGTDLSFEGLPFASGISWSLPNGPNDGFSGLPSMDMMAGIASSGLVFFQ
ncbi:Fungal specific transcription factor domain [Rhizoctonia solani]|uniref:Fungal specific transcription factor domain n=1 Tax=Rhizoctonia solani TaxID=456999 RepID=A0A8H7M2B1_9AGAM|nr:Fungal specific transcription factor domain [Rhizoctonia solani]